MAGDTSPGDIFDLFGSRIVWDPNPAFGSNVYRGTRDEAAVNCFRAFNSSLVASFNDGPPDDESTLADHLDKISCYQGGKNMNFVYPVVERNGEFPGTQWNNFHFGISDTSEYGFVLQNFNNCNDLNAFPIALSVKQEYCEDHGQIDGEECEWINNKCELNGGLHWQEVSASVSTDDQGKRQFSSLYDVAASLQWRRLSPVGSITVFHHLPSGFREVRLWTNLVPPHTFRCVWSLLPLELP